VPRSIWKGVISFGLVAIPIRVYLATESKSVHFRLLCPKHKEPIKMRRWCVEGEHEVAWNDALRGFEISKGRYVILDEEDLEKIPLPTTKTIEIARFVNEDDVHGELYYQNAYYLEPDQAAAKPYALLRKALGESKRLAIAKVAFRDREHLCALRPVDEVLLMNTLFWPDEIRSYGELDLPERISVNARELQMAKNLIDAMTSEFDPSEFKDEYREALMALIKAKQKGKEEIVEVEEPEPTAVADLMEALKKSVEQTKKAERARRVGRKPSRAA
jgi:DNA end-binding protein Ku